MQGLNVLAERDGPPDAVLSVKTSAVDPQSSRVTVRANPTGRGLTNVVVELQGVDGAVQSVTPKTRAATTLSEPTDFTFEVRWFGGSPRRAAIGLRSDTVSRNYLLELEPQGEAESRFWPYVAIGSGGVMLGLALLMVTRRKGSRGEDDRAA